MYRARPGTELASSGLPMGWRYRGYQVMVFPQDDGTLSALVERPTADAALAPLRHNGCFEAVAPLIPQLAPWIDPRRFEPITDVMSGGGLTNSYRGQLDEHGRAAIPGLFFVGDTVCTTYPAAGRGVSLGLRQAQALVGMLAVLNPGHNPGLNPGHNAGLNPGLNPGLPRRGADLGDVAEQFDAWCTANIRPWYEDHVYWDATLRYRLGGGDIDIEARIPSDVVCAAAEVDPAIWPAAGPYLAMQALPAVLDPVRDRARAVLRTGWRPPYTTGPSRDELADACNLRVRSAA